MGSDLRNMSLGQGEDVHLSLLRREEAVGADPCLEREFGAEGVGGEKVVESPDIVVVYALAPLLHLNLMPNQYSARDAA